MSKNTSAGKVVYMYIVRYHSKQTNTINSFNPSDTYMRQ